MGFLFFSVIIFVLIVFVSLLLIYLNHTDDDDFRTYGANWVEKNLGAEYVEEFLDKHDKACSGVPFGGYYETAIFVHLMDEIRKDYERESRTMRWFK